MSRIHNNNNFYLPLAGCTTEKYKGQRKKSSKETHAHVYAAGNGSIYHGGQLTQVELLPPKHRAQREILRYRNREVVILPAALHCYKGKRKGSLNFSFYSFLRTIIVPQTGTNNKIMQSSKYFTVALLSSLTLIRMTKDEKGLAFFKGLLL
jgi:hypothetical protein